MSSVKNLPGAGWPQRPVPQRPAPPRRPGWQRVLLVAGLLPLWMATATRAAGAAGPVALSLPETVAIDVAWEDGAWDGTAGHEEATADVAPEEGGPDAVTVTWGGAAVPVSDVRAARTVPGRFVVFVDDVFCMPAPRNRFLRRMADQLDALGPDDRMAVVAFDGSKLTVLTSWTRSVPRLTAALTEARQRPALGPRRLAEQRQRSASTRSTAAGAGTASSFSGVGFGGATASSLEAAGGLGGARTVTEQVAGLMRAAAAAIERLAAEDATDGGTTDGGTTDDSVGEGDPRLRQGRGTLLMLAGTWTVSPEAWVLSLPGDDGAVAGLAAAPHVMAPLVAAADHHGFAVSPVTVPVWGTRGRATRRAASTTATGTGNRLMDELLDALAVDTGGTSWFDGSGSSILRRAVDDARRGLRLFVRPTWRQDDQRRPLRVAMERETAVLRARAGLADPAVTTRLARLAAATAIGAIGEGADGLIVDIERQGRGAVQLSVRFAPTLDLPTEGLSWFVVDPSLAVPVAIPATATDLVASERAEPSYSFTSHVRPGTDRVVLSAYHPATGRLWSKVLAVPSR